MKYITQIAYNINYGNKYPVINYINPITNQVVKGKKYFIDGNNERIFIVTSKQMKELTQGKDMITR